MALCALTRPTLAAKMGRRYQSNYAQLELRRGCHVAAALASRASATRSTTSATPCVIPASAMRMTAPKGNGNGDARCITRK